MKFSIITLFPQVVKTYINESIMKRAANKNLVEFDIVDLRDYSTYKHKQVDDYQFGGGKGMVLMVEPIYNAINAIKTPQSIVCMMTPQGKTWNQIIAKTYAIDYKHIILLCGHYEGFDERIIDYVDVELSIGDFVITGGELAALTIIDSIVRLLPGVIDVYSVLQESFESNLLDYPVYTKPVDFQGKKVPDVLLSGHHANINKYRQEQALLNTFNKRPDLLQNIELSKEQLVFLEKIKLERK